MKRLAWDGCWAASDKLPHGIPLGVVAFGTFSDTLSRG